MKISDPSLITLVPVKKETEGQENIFKKAFDNLFESDHTFKTAHPASEAATAEQILKQHEALQRQQLENIRLQRDLNLLFPSRNPIQQ